MFWLVMVALDVLRFIAVHCWLSDVSLLLRERDLGERRRLGGCVMIFVVVSGIGDWLHQSLDSWRSVAVRRVGRLFGDQASVGEGQCGEQCNKLWEKSQVSELPARSDQQC